MHDEYLIHFNPNHDPKTGKFSKSKIGSTAVRAAAIGAAVGAGRAKDRRRQAAFALGNSDRMLGRIRCPVLHPTFRAFDNAHLGAPHADPAWRACRLRW